MSLEHMKTRMNFIGGKTSDGRIVDGKYNSFRSVLWNSHQAEWITFNDKKYRCLITTDKLSQDYDQKIISIDYDAGMQNGDVFYWDRTDTYWIVFLQQISEEAYFRATIRRCRYQIKDWWVYTRGPEETDLKWNQKHSLEFNEMNYSILLYVVRNAETDEYFKRFQIVELDGHNWRIAAVDRYSQPGLIEVYLEEYFDNEMEKEMIKPEEVKHPDKEPHIEGPQIVKAYDTGLTYMVVGKNGGRFAADSKKIKLINVSDTTCTIDILTGKSTTFDLKYIVNDEEIVQKIIVQSL